MCAAKNFKVYIKLFSKEVPRVLSVHIKIKARLNSLYEYRIIIIDKFIYNI